MRKCPGFGENLGKNFSYFGAKHQWKGPMMTPGEIEFLVTAFLAIGP